jgi:small-conductance mechanosensitive channel|tara:strand:+ start:53 stop:925 length:873 start_codon:yes stop_codon:yes gene_type:complete
MPELENVEAQKTAGYMSRSRSKYKDKIKKEEEELKQLMEQQGQATEEKTEKKVEEAKPEVELSDEEKSFKTRYGDVRRHLAAKEKEYNAKIKELEDKLGQTEKLVPPKSDDDIAAWAEKYPDVAGIVETIADKKAKQMFDKANLQIEELNKAKEEATRSRAENEIREAHSDFDKLRDSDEFHNWVEEQPKWVQNALYENTDDAASVIRVIDLYKVDNGLTRSDTKNKRKAAASLVDRGSKTKVDPSEMSDKIKESEIAKMSDAEYAKHADKITEAHRSGKIIYDLSGNAR